MNSFIYILNKDKNPIPAKDSAQASRLLSNLEARRVAYDEIFVEDYGITIRISTIFLVVDHRSSLRGKPVLFESIIFNGKLDQSMNRYCTWKEAEKGHKKMVELVKNDVWVSRILDKAAKTFTTKAITKTIIEGLKNELYLN